MPGAYASGDRPGKAYGPACTETGVASANGVMLMKGDRYVRPAQAWTPDEAPDS